MAARDIELQLTNEVFEACGELQSAADDLRTSFQSSSSAEAVVATARWEKRRRRLERKIILRAKRLVSHWRSEGASAELLDQSIHRAAIQRAVDGLPEEHSDEIAAGIGAVDSICDRVIETPTLGDNDETWEELTALNSQLKPVIGPVVDACQTATNWNRDRNQDWQIETLKQAASRTPGISLSLDEVVQWPDGTVEQLRHEQIEGLEPT